MAAVKWYFTATGLGLSGYTDDPADNEVELSTTAPGSGTLSASIAKGSAEAWAAAGTDAAPHASTHRDWSALPASQTTISVDVNSTHADLTLNPSALARWDSSGAEQANSGGVAGWDSNSGTGTKVWTNTGAANLGVAATTDLFGAVVVVDNGGHMDPQTIVINLGSSTYVEFSGGAPASLSLVCGAECQIHNTGSGAAADSHWSERFAGNSGTPEASTTEARSGAYSLYFSSVTGSQISRLGHDLGAPGSQKGYYYRFYFRMPDVTPTNDVIIGWLGGSTNQDGIGVMLDVSEGTIRLVGTTNLNGAHTPYSSTNDFAPSVDTWYGVEVQADLSVTNSYVAQWRTWSEAAGWSSSEEITTIAGQTSSDPLFYVGVITDAGEADWVVYVDDIAVGPASWTGAFYDDTGTNGVSGKVLRYSPTSDGNHSVLVTGNFQKDGTTDIAEADTDTYQWVDDADMEGTGDYVNGNGADDSDWLRWAFADESTEDDPRGVSVVGHLVGANGNIFMDTTLVQPFPTSGAGTGFLQGVLAQHSSAVAWTRTLINSTEIRFKAQNSGDTPQVHSIALEVEWTAEGASTVNGSFTADAVIKDTQAGSFTADAIVQREQAGSFTADAVIVREQVGSLTADAIIFATIENSLAADAVLYKEQAATFTADAYLLNRVTGSLVADAVVRAPQGATLTADAVVAATQQAQITADAVVFKSQTASLDADAVVLAVQAAGLTGDAIVQRQLEGSYTADAVLYREQTGQFTADAWILGGGMAGFTADAVVKAPISAGLAVDAVIFRVQVGSFDVDAVIAAEQTDQFAADAVLRKAQVGSLSADAVITANVVGSLTADAVIKGAQTASFTADAVIFGTIAAAFTADAVVLAAGTGGFSADATLLRVQAQQATADAVLHREQSAVFTADAWVAGSGTAGITADAVLLGERTGGFAADALIRIVVESDFDASAIILAPVEASLTADATILRTQGDGLAVDAVIQRGQVDTFTADAVLHAELDGAFSADATVQATLGASVTADAVIKGAQTASFTADAVIKGDRVSSLAADAIIARAQSASFTADAIVQATPTASFTADAWLVVGSTTDSFTADAVIRGTHSGTLTADAVLSATQAATFAADAVIAKTQSQALIADAVLLATRTAGITADAVFLSPRTASFAADAVITDLIKVGSFTADAWIRGLHPYALGAENETTGFLGHEVTATDFLGQESETLFLGNEPYRPALGSFTADAVIVL